jgi:hypothetical protein
MAEIRALRDEDIPQVARLQESAFLGRAVPSSTGLEAYLRLVFLRNPWQDLGLPSLVRVADDGRIVGFLGVIARPMRFRGRAIRVAICHRFAALPDAKDRMGGLHLLRALLSGDQDLSLTDCANLDARAVWQSLRGETCLARSLTWVRPLRPAAYAGRLARQHTRRRWLGAGLAAASRPLDWALARGSRAFARIPASALREEAIDESALLAEIESLSSPRSLRPVYDRASLRWLLEVLGENRHRGRFRAVSLRDPAGAAAGFVLDYGNPGGVDEVLELAAHPRRAEAVCDHVLWRAQEDGAVAVRGRLEPALLEPLARRRVVWSLPDGNWTLLCARDPEIAGALQRGDAWFGALEGELWLRSPHDDLRPAAAHRP